MRLRVIETDLRLGLDILHGEVTTIDESWSYDLCSHYWRLYWNDRPGATLTCGAQVISLRPQHLYLIPALTLCHGHNTRQLRHLYIHFLPRGLQGVGESNVLSGIHVLPLTPVLQAAKDELIQETEAATTWLRTRALVAWALADAIAALPAALHQDVHARLHGDSRLQPVLDHIHHQPARPYDVASLAALVGLSHDHFARLFKKEFGMTVTHYLRRVRVSLAAEALIATNDPIESIAEALGFANRYHFTRVFTKTLGRSPARYRRQGWV